MISSHKPYRSEKRANDLNEAFKLLASGVFKSVNCRAHASRRLERHHLFSFITTLIYSFSLVVFSVLMLSGFHLAVSDEVVNLGLLVVSIVITVMSIIWALFDFNQHARTFHLCQLELQQLNYDLTQLMAKPAALSEDKFEEVNTRYHEILHRYPQHKPIDFEQFRFNDTSAELKKKTKVKWKYYRAFFREFSPYLSLLCLLLVIIIVFSIFGSFPSEVQAGK